MVLMPDDQCAFAGWLIIPHTFVLPPMLRRQLGTLRATNSAERESTRRPRADLDKSNVTAVYPIRPAMAIVCQSSQYRLLSCLQFPSSAVTLCHADQLFPKSRRLRNVQQLSSADSGTTVRAYN